MDTPAPAGWRGAYGGWLFAAVFFVAAGLGFVGPLGIAPLTSIAGLLALPMARPGRHGPLGVVLVAALALWAVFSMIWSRADFPPVRSYGDLQDLTGVKLVLQAAFYSALALAAARLQPQGAERALRWLAFTLAILALLLMVEGLTNAQIYQSMEAMVGQPIRPDLARRNVAQGGYLIAVMIWPALVLLRREGRKRTVLALFAGIIVTVFLFSADAPGAALITGFAAFAATQIYGRKAVLTVMGLAVTYLLAAPWAVLAAVRVGLFDRLHALMPPSWDQRLDIWAFAAARVAERPLQGWGLDASRTWPRIIPLHTHDAALQLWLELGAVGVLIAAGVWIFLFWMIARAGQARGFMAAACAAATAYLTIGALSFGVWQEWWLAIGALAVCACLALRRAETLWLTEDAARPAH